MHPLAGMIINADQPAPLGGNAGGHLVKLLIPRPRLGGIEQVHARFMVAHVVHIDRPAKPVGLAPQADVMAGIEIAGNPVRADAAL